MKHLRKAIAILLVLASLMGLCSMAGAAWVREYEDYHRSAWYFRYVEKATDAGWMNGVGEGKFDPDGTLNRAMFVTILHRMQGTPAAAKSAGFSDVVKGAWYENAVNWAAENGVVTGYEDGRFGINDPLTREQMATILYRFAKAQGKDVSGKGDISAFTDKGEISSYATDAFAWAVDAGIITGAGNALTPKGTSTRAQAATVLVRFDAREEAATLTRADLEQAIVQTAWAYYLKGTKIQYDSVELSLPILSKYYGGNCRLTIDVAPEFGTDDMTIFSVCSDYCQKTYYNALNERIYGYDLDWVTANMWNMADMQFGQKLTLVRYFKPEKLAGHYKYGNGHTDPDTKTGPETRAWLENWEQNMRPGDVISSDHTLLYIGNGYVLDCWGGKYSLESGMDKYEEVGSISDALHRFEDLYLTGKDPVMKKYSFNEKGETGLGFFCVWRPLDTLCVDDGDGDPSNDKVVAGTSIPDVTKSRLKYPGMEIDRTVSITPFRAVATGENLTYSVKVSNMSNEARYAQYYGVDANKAYSGLVVTEKVPEGTEFVSATNGGKHENGTITWVIDLAAGEMKDLSYTVKVNAKPGEFIVSEGGWVGNIPSNSIKNRVGGKKLSADAKTAMTAFYNNYGMDWVQTYGLELKDNTAMAEEFYSKVVGKTIEVPELQQLIDGIFEQKHVNVKNGVGYHDGRSKEAWMHAVRADAFEKNPMLVPTYMGGVSSWFKNDQDRINEFSPEYLEAGDLLFYVNLSKYPNSSAKRTAESGKIIMWLDNEQYAVYDVASGSLVRGEGTAELWKAFTYDLFFVLRPSQLAELKDSGKQVTAMDPAQAEAESRKKYPGISVEQTVSCGKFGSAITGDKLTYTIAVTNGSAAEYKGLPVMSSIPTGTQLVTAEGAKNESGRLMWTIDVPAGKTVSVTYTVKVTGKAGQTVETGGKVDNIPMEPMGTRVGKKLWNATLNSRLEKLNSMTGEQMLTDVNLKDVRALDQIRILYNWVRKGKAEIGDANGYIEGVGNTKNYYQASGKNAEGLYTIGEGPTGSSIIAGTIVPGFFGGKEVSPVGSKLTKETISTDGVMAGDVLYQCDGKNVKFCFFTGEKFIVMDSGKPNGTTPEIVEAQTLLDSCYSDTVMFFALLRPSFMVGS